MCRGGCVQRCSGAAVQRCSEVGSAPPGRSTRQNSSQGEGEKQLKTTSKEPSAKGKRCLGVECSGMEPRGPMLRPHYSLSLD